jgi:hypothetical protein
VNPDELSEEAHCIIERYTSDEDPSDVHESKIQILVEYLALMVEMGCSKGDLLRVRTRICLGAAFNMGREESDVLSAT